MKKLLKVVLMCGALCANSNAMNREVDEFDLIQITVDTIKKFSTELTEVKKKSNETINVLRKELNDQKKQSDQKMLDLQQMMLQQIELLKIQLLEQKQKSVYLQQFRCAGIYEKTPGDKLKETFFEAAKTGDAELCQFLVEKKPWLIDMVDDDNWTALHRAANSGHLEVCKFLVEKKPGLLDMVTTSSKTALHLAAQSGSRELCQYLVEKKPGLLDMVTTGKYNAGRTALHFAAGSGNLELCQFLVGKKPELLDNIHLEYFSANQEVKAYLKSKVAK